MKTSLARVVLALAFGCGLCATGLQAQTYWNFGTSSGDAAATALGTDVAASVVSQGNNNGTTTLLTTTSASSGYTGASGQYNAGAAARIGALNTGASGSAYFEVTLTPQNGATLTLTGLSFGARSTSTGPQAYCLRSSADGYATDIVTGTLSNNSTWVLKSHTGMSVVFSSATTFRIYGYSGTGSPTVGSANWRIDDLAFTTTTGGTDTTPPVWSTLNPADGATGVAVGANLVATFSEPIMAGSGNIEIRLGADDSLVSSIPIADAQVTIAGNTLTINPSADLALATAYYVLIPAGAVKDAANNPFVGILANTEWNFTTLVPDTTPPTATLTPVDDSTAVPIRSKLALAFNEPVVKGTGNIELRLAADDTLVESIDVTTAAVVLTGSTATIRPGSPLPLDSGIYVIVPNTAFADTAGNPYPGIVTNGGWNFATVAVDPALVINEVDADTPGTDAAEFIEIYDGGVGNTPLDGYVLVLFNGANDLSYYSVDLDGYSTNAQGYFVVGNAAVANVGLAIPGDSIQNGADAVALYFGNAADFPNGTPPTTTDLIDAIVYDTNDADDAALLAALGQTTQHDEGASPASEGVSLSRLPDGTATIVTRQPTPGISNSLDVTPPTLLSRAPVDNMVDVPVATDLVLTFNEAVAAGAGSITIHKAADNSVVHTLSASGGAVNIVGTTVTINPPADLEFGTAYYVIVDATALTDAAGNPYAGIAAVDAWNFTTVTPPTLVSHTPADDATNIAVRSNLVLTFSETVSAGTGNILIKRGGDDSVLESIDVQGPLVSVLGATVTINPSANLPVGTGVYVTIPNTAFVDASGTPFAGLATNTAWNFSTVAVDPALVINEIDADQAGATDAAEFIELYDGGVGNTPLDGYVLVLFNGANDLSYFSVDLDGYSTDANGYLVIGNAAVPGVAIVFDDGTLQNGADAVALYASDATAFPNGTPPTTTDLIDAIVYDTSDADDAALLAALGQMVQHDENANGLGTTQSLSRTPDAATLIVAQAPTPGATNSPVGSTFANWIDGFYNGETDPAIIGLAVDPDHDGVPNGVEAWFGSFPNAAGASGLAATGMNGSDFTFTCPRSKSPPTDLSAAYEWSTDLENWHASGADVGGLIVQVTDVLVDDTDPEVAVYQVTATVTSGTTAQLFVRVAVQQTPL